MHIALTPDIHPPSLLTRRRHLAAWALVLCSSLAWAQAPATANASEAATAKTHAARLGPPPAWKALSTAQQEALAPLAPVWGEISSNRKRKWIALSANFKTMPPADKATLQGRMKEWASLSTADRNRARLSFAQTSEFSHDEKKAQWEAYQALSPERKKQLAALAGQPAHGAAPAVTTNTSRKLAAVPVTRSDPAATTKAKAGASAPAASAKP
jgi:hypothetical protein